ncbi:MULTISPECIES: DNA-binding protein [unclassified Streptomyces]|uniref:DNA-binding protein n=1 Tax=unclassified Streptomyces TaxID=2593676 RepID=UPI002256A3B7|nr:MULTISPECIES: DNA-binding protein [unclassified Streptomyces]MCX4524204.1 DNA-binding protein [Streptomyces sp. NBC_01551]MCX4545277.1 DNA-binding protein [Streptomyces sp. NBC_01565]
MNTTTENKKGRAVSEAELLLKAGAVLPPGTPDAGAQAVDLTARAYRHPALAEDRVVVRLAAAELGPAEDLAAGFLGLVPEEGEPPVVGLGQRQALGFPEWVLVHHPEDGHHALAIVPELDRAARQAKTKPKAALDACLEMAGRLAAAVPHFLPVFYEQAARVFLAVENTTYAGQLFSRARKAEAQHGLTVDEERLDAAFLEFALAGALPVKVLTGYGKELAVRVSPAEAFERFRRLCVRRTAGGLAPSAQVAVELRRLAKAAGLTGTEPEQEYLAELLPLPATLRAAYGWWTAHRGALIALARRVPAVRGTLLGLTLPGGGDGDLTGLWLDVLEESGATAGLTGEQVPAEERSPDGTAGWLERFHKARHTGWGQRPTPPFLLDIVERSAARLRAELARPGREDGLRVTVQDVDLVDLLLSLEIPVAAPDPKGNAQLNLSDWARAEQRRDLVALGADERFHPAFRAALNGLSDAGEDIVRRVAAAPGGRPLLTEWVREVARSSKAAGLPGVPDAIRRLTWLPYEALELAPEEVAAAAATDLGETLARTLRAGLLEELTWPAWESAVAEMRPGQGRQDLTVVEAWPYLIVANQTQVRVLDADGAVLTHDLRAPSGNSYQYGFHYVDGALLVFWSSWSTNTTEGYWHTAPDAVFTLDTNGQRHWQLRSDSTTLPLPGGGRATGAGVLHAGDTALPAEREMLSDGTSYWVWEGWDRNRAETPEPGWREYDPTAPAGASHGRRSLPGVLSDALRGHPEGAKLSLASCRLRPAPTVEGSVLGAPVDGLLGWRPVHVRGRGWHACDLAGRTVTAPEGHDMPLAALVFPGDERPRALSARWRQVSLADPDGVVTLQSRDGHRAAGYATGSVDLPPLDHWYALRPRDPESSAALRAADRETVGALLKAAVEVRKAEELPDLVSAALPGVTDPKMIGGVVEALRFAVTQQKSLDRVAARLHPETGAVAETVRGPVDRLIGDALNGLTGTGYYSWGGDNDTAHRFLRELAAARALADAPEVPGRLHFEMPVLPYSGLPFTPLLDHPAAIAYRAVAVGTSEEERAALVALLQLVDELGLDCAEGSAAHWRRVLIHLDQRHLSTPDGLARSVPHRAVLPLGGGAVLGLTEHDTSVPDGHQFGALLYDPTGRLDVPGPYTALGDAPLGEREHGQGWLAAFLGEAAERGSAPFLPEAAEEFSRLTGVSGVMAKLIVAGLPRVDSWQGNFLPADERKVLGVKATEAGHARDELKALAADVRQAVVAALLPADPARLWSEGPDVAAAAAVWNRRVGRRTPVPDWLATEAARIVRHGWAGQRGLPALLDPAAAPELSTDVAWKVVGDHVEAAVPTERPFTSAVLTGSLALAAWLAHRLPAGDALRAGLPPVLTALRQRLAAPELLLSYGGYADLTDFRKAAGNPTETGAGYERYGAVVLPTHDFRPKPALRPALLDSTGSDPYLPLLRGDEQRPDAVETALRAVHEPAFARLLADPGAPAAGEADADGTWWPQDPSRSVPGLVAEAAEAYGLGADAAALYLTLLAMPDPTDRNIARWTGWKPARLKAARAELAATDLVVEASRSRAGRSLFLPGGWAEMSSPVLPLEAWKLSMYGPAGGRYPTLGVLVPTEPVAELYERAWRRVREGDAPRFEELKVKRTRTRRR